MKYAASIIPVPDQAIVIGTDQRCGSGWHFHFRFQMVEQLIVAIPPTNWKHLGRFHILGTDAVLSFYKDDNGYVIIVIKVIVVTVAGTVEFN